MKIGLVRRGFARAGGAESYLKRLGKILAEHGHTTTLYTSQEWPLAEWPYGKLIRLKERSPERFARELPRRRVSDDLLFSLERVLQCDCYRAGDGVHRCWLRRRAKYEPAWRAKFRALQRKHIEMLALEEEMFQQAGARFVIANSELVKNEIVSEFNVPEDRIGVIYNGLPDNRFTKKPSKRSEIRSSLGLADTDIALLFAGSGWARKGLRFALAALRQIKDRRFKLLVAGTDRRPLFAASHVQYLGPMDNLESIYRAADLFILPTIYDPFSNACLEAVSFGLPVITTRANGFSEIMQSGVHGCVIPQADDIAALRQAIETWSDAALRTTARPACLELAAGYTMQRNMDKTLAVLENLARVKTGR